MENENTQPTLMPSESHLGGGKKIPVTEIFGPTIEGEGALIGTQTFFIRFGLCDFKCKKCDSMHSVDPKLVKANADWAVQQDIGDSFKRFQEQKAPHIHNVTFSGGNPAVHDLSELCHYIHGMYPDQKIFVETQGTKSPDWLYNVDHIVVSPKSPGMGESFDPEVFLNFMGKYCAAGVPMSVKIVIFSQLDIEFAAGVAALLFDHGFGMGGGFLRFQVERDFFLSLGNPNPPIFKAVVSDKDGSTSVIQVEQEDKIALLRDPMKKEIPNKKTLVENLLCDYNNLSEQVMKDPRLSFARFLPQLHVLVWGNEIGK